MRWAGGKGSLSSSTDRREPQTSELYTASPCRHRQPRDDRGSVEPPRHDALSRRSSGVLRRGGLGAQPDGGTDSPLPGSERT